MRAAATILLVCLMPDLVKAQNPKPPTPLPPEIQTVDQLPKDAVVLWIDGQNLTVYVDSTSNADDQNKITTLQIKWEGPGPGFVEENCDCDNIFTCDWCELCCQSQRIAKVRTRGIGPAYSLGNLMPEGYMETWNPAESWIVDGSYLTGGTLDKFDPNSPHFGPFVPEPSSVILMVFGILALIRVRRRH